MPRATRIAATVVLAVLAAATAYEAAVAAGSISVGPLPGEGPAGGDAVLTAAVAAMLVGAGVSLAAAGLNEGPSAAEALLAPAAAAFVVARFYAYDPYYAPTLRRMSEDGAVPDWWIFLLAGAAVVVAAAAAGGQRLGPRLTALVTVTCAVTALWEGAGH